uniref:Ig-like domain-containing protein n=1 Tax=Acrobeloides nanus TaxID=290746 RepID=A0A914ERZ5_9BILA
MVKGSPKETLKVKDGLGHVLLHPLQLWCQAVDEISRRPVKINSAHFYPLRDNKVKFEAKLSKNNENASISLENVPSLYAGRFKFKKLEYILGNWTCVLQLATPNNQEVNGTIQVLVPPVIWNTNSSLRIDTTHHDFTLKGSGVTVLRNQKVELTCPVVGNPKPYVYWTKESKNLTKDEHYSFEGTSLFISNVTDAHGGLYKCIARSTFGTESKEAKPHELTLERQVRIKSQIAWLWPLIIIFVILVLLIVIITLCEFRRKSNEQKLILEAPDDE